MTQFHPLHTLANRLKGLVIAAGVASLMGLSAQTALAADAAPPKIDPKVQAQAMTDAPSLISAAHVQCDPSDAYIQGQADQQKDGKKVKLSIYEIACKAGPGFIAVAASPTEVTQTINCLLAESANKKQGTGAVCILPENQPSYKWLTPVVKTYLPQCDVNNARYIGSSNETKIDRYEVGCANGLGGLVDYPQMGSTASVSFLNCVVVEGSASACQFTSQDAINASLKPLAAKADAQCQVNNVRFVGAAKDSNGLFYEFGCSNKPGFIVMTDGHNAFQREVSCAEAAGLGGCKFTDTTAAVADAKSGYTSQLKAAGYTCTVQDFNILGSQPDTKRDFIEFKCPEKPWGLIGFVPQTGSKGSIDLHDCFLAQTTRHQCSLITEAQLNAQMDKLIKAAEPGKNCDVSQVRYIGELESEANGIMVEVACVNKRGYLVGLSPDRTKLEDPTPCKLAKAHGLQQECTIPGNGTYTD